MRRWIFMAALSATLLGVPGWGQTGARASLHTRPVPARSRLQPLHLGRKFAKSFVVERDSFSSVRLTDDQGGGRQACQAAKNRLSSSNLVGLR